MEQEKKYSPKSGKEKAKNHIHAYRSLWGAKGSRPFASAAGYVCLRGTPQLSGTAPGELQKWATGDGDWGRGAQDDHCLLICTHAPLPCFASGWLPGVKTGHSLKRTSIPLPTLFQDDGQYQKKLSPNQLHTLLVGMGIHACLSIRDANIWQHQKLIGGGGWAVPITHSFIFPTGEPCLRCLLTLDSSNVAVETIIHAMVNNEYTKKKGSNFLVPFVDSKLEALMHHHLASLISHSHY